MDEKKFPIPPKSELKADEIESEEIEITEEPESGLIKTFSNDDNTKAVNLLVVETDEDGNFVARIGKDELREIADDILSGGEDTRGLQVGDVYDGDTAYADADEEAMRLVDEHGPDDVEASDEELASAAMAIKDDSKEFKSVGFGSPEYRKDNEKLGKELSEEEPALKQLTEAAKGK